jgi:glycine dehydrogenase
VLLAVIASMYAVYHGPQGLKRIAQRVASYTAVLAAGLRELGVAVRSQTAFDTMTSWTPARPPPRSPRAGGRRHEPARFREWGDTMLGIALDENTTREDPGPVAAVRREGQALPGFERSRPASRTLVPRACAAAAPSSPHPVFNTAPQRDRDAALHPQASDKDLALDRSMIPLGSCTMKLNATSEMIPITWPAFAHPSLRAGRPGPATAR